jgi:hypothetical protein
MVLSHRSRPAEGHGPCERARPGTKNNEGGKGMAKYGKKAGKKVAKAVHEQKRGKLKSGGSGKKVKSRKQAIAIGLSEARKQGAKVPAKKSGKRAGKKSAGKKSSGKKSNPRKRSAKNSSAKRSSAKRSGAKKSGAKKSSAKKSRG